MRHRKRNVKFGRQTSHYKATLKHLVAGLITNKSISTTRMKAKEASRLAEKLVTMAKKNTVASRRKAYSVLGRRELVSILFNDIGPLFRERAGGYTRVMLTGSRKGDNAQMAILEFVEKPLAEPVKKEKKKKKEKAVPKPEPVAKTREQVEQKEVPAEEKKKEDQKKSEEAQKKKKGLLKKFFGKDKENK